MVPWRSAEDVVYRFNRGGGKVQALVERFGQLRELVAESAQGAECGFGTVDLEM
jgi:hypothetical protein